MEYIAAVSTFLPEEQHFYGDVYCEECQCFVKELCWLHAITVKDAPTVPLAVASLPDVLYLADSIERGNSVYAKRTLSPHTIFGPLVAHGHTSTLTWKMDNDHCSNWMKFVSVVGQWEEPNLRLLLRDEQVVFVSVKVVLSGEELKVAVEPRYMPMMDPNSAKPTRLADVHLHIPQDSSDPAKVSGEIPENVACNVKNIVVDEYTVRISDFVGVPTNFTAEPDPAPQFPLRITVKSAGLLDLVQLPGSPFPPFFVAPSVPEEQSDSEDAMVDSCTETNSEQKGYTARQVTNIMTDTVVDDDVSTSGGVLTNLTVERDPIPRFSFSVTGKTAASSEREGSPEYPFPPVCAAPTVPNEEMDDRRDASTADQCDSSIGRYPLRSRVAADAGRNGNNSPEQEALPIDPCMKECGEMVDDSDVDADYRLSASDDDSSADSESLPCRPLPSAKKPKPSHTDSANHLNPRQTTLPSQPTAAADPKTPSSTPAYRSVTLKRGAASAASSVPGSSRYRQRFVCKGYPSDVYRFICPECSRHFHNEQLFDWHRQFQHAAVVTTPWRSGIGCTVCQRSFTRYHAMVGHVEQHGVKPDRVKHYRSTSDPSIMRHLSSQFADAPSFNHEGHALCFFHSSSVCHSHACTLRFCTEELAAVHAMQHVPQKTYEGGLVCPGCGYTAENVGQLVEHVSQHGAERDDRKMCRLCGQFKLDLQVHMASLHKAEYGLLVKETNPEKCEHCGKVFKSKALLKGHSTLLHTTQRVQCFVCAKQFPTTHALKKHSEEHQTKNGLICPTCQQVFPAYRAFSLHVKKHDVRLMRVCEVCHALFATASQLAQHMLSHGSDYKYRCEPCDKKFKRSGDLWQHNKYVHGDGMKQRRKELKDKLVKKGYVCPRRRMDYEDFPHKCQECKLGWLKLGGLEQHRMRKHGAVVCTEPA